jgi:hypothetical protein
MKFDVIAGHHRLGARRPSSVPSASTFIHYSAVLLELVIL